MRLRAAGLSAVLTLVCSSATLADTKFAVDPEAGNNTFTAVFDAAVGERITGTVLYLPAKEYDAAETPRTPARPHDVPRTIRIRARIEGFDRERYRVGPRWTAGWLARVQQLAPVVATEGTIEVNLFAMEAGGK